MVKSSKKKGDSIKKDSIVFGVFALMILFIFLIGMTNFLFTGYSVADTDVINPFVGVGIIILVTSSYFIIKKWENK